MSVAQNNIIKINAKLNFQKWEIQMQQEIKYYNNSNDILDTLYFHNWANSYKNRRTPLSKRLIEDYDKSLYFAKANTRGFSDIKGISRNNLPTKWEIDKNSPDIIRVILDKGLQPNDSTTISLTYVVKVPEDIFTRYGRVNNTYNLRFWYITPVVYDQDWHFMSNLNMDDLYMDPADYIINLTTPEGINVNTDLELSKTVDTPYNIYHLTGKNRVDIELNITVFNDFKTFKTEPVQVITNLNGTILEDQIKTDIISRELSFIERHLGSYPHDKLLVNRISYDKNPIYGLNQLPKMFNPFSGAFEWDIKMFKALTRKYL